MASSSSPSQRKVSESLAAMNLRKTSSAASPGSGPFCLVFMRNGFGTLPADQAQRAHQWIVAELGADYVISTRLYFHGHFATGEKMKAALTKSQSSLHKTPSSSSLSSSSQLPSSSSEYRPAGSPCLQKACGQERHSNEARIRKAGLDYASVRRWIIANKRIILTDEVFRDARNEEKQGKPSVVLPPLPEFHQPGQSIVPETKEETVSVPASAPVSSSIAPVAAASGSHSSPTLGPAVPGSVPVEAGSALRLAAASPSLANGNADANSAPSSTATPSSNPPAPAPRPTRPAPSGLKVYVKSRQGQSWDPNKVNQDRPLACVPLRGHPGVHVYGVMDGHGQHGHYVSEYCMHQLPACLASEKSLRTDPSASITSAVKRLCSELAESNINLAFSGTTCVFGVHVDRQMYVANIGDSRCVLCRESLDGTAQVIPLTTDHKPDSPGEMQRILAKGGRVCPIPGMDHGPARVWLADLDEPGLAMSRSIGDEVSQTVGVTSIPEIVVHPISDRDLFAIFASDGIWEFISNEEATQILFRNRHDPALAVNQLVAEAVKRWQEDSEQVIDDITVVLVMFK